MHRAGPVRPRTGRSDRGRTGGLPPPSPPCLNDPSPAGDPDTGTSPNSGRQWILAHGERRDAWWLRTGTGGRPGPWVRLTPLSDRDSTPFRPTPPPRPPPPPPPCSPHPFPPRPRQRRPAHDCRHHARPRLPPDPPRDVSGGRPACPRRARRPPPHTPPY